MSIQKIRTIGLTRWSYPFRGRGFRKGGADLERLRAELYAPRRLDHRLFLLEQVVLPGLRDQTDPDFTHLFLMGDQLPDPWRSRVLALLKTVPQIKPIFEPEGGKHREVCRRIMREEIDGDCDATAQYRLDDDDGVGVRFIECAKSRLGDVQKVFEKDGRLALDFNQGFILKSSAKDISLRPVSMRFWAPGMIVFQRPESKKCILDFNHVRIWHYMTTLTSQDEPMFIRGAHHDNDSDLDTFGRRTRSFDFSHRNPERFFQRRFGLDVNAITEEWEKHKDYFLNTSVSHGRRRSQLRIVA